MIGALVIPWVDDFPDDIARPEEPQMRSLTQMKDALHSETERRSSTRRALLLMPKLRIASDHRLKTSVIEEP